MTTHPDFSRWYDRLTAIEASLRDGNEAAIKPALAALHAIGDLADDTATEALEDAIDALYTAEEGRPEFIRSATNALDDCTDRLLVIKEVRGW